MISPKTASEKVIFVSNGWAFQMKIFSVLINENAPGYGFVKALMRLWISLRDFFQLINPSSGVLFG